MRDSLVNTVPALRVLQSQVAAAEQQQQQEMAAMDARIQKTVAAIALVSNVMGRPLTPAQKVEQAAQERARINERLNQLAGGGLDFSKVPTVDASGTPLSEMKRVSIAILNSQLYTANGQAAAAGEFAVGYKNRVNEALAAELGFNPEQALNDPKVLAKEIVTRLPFDSEGNFNKDQLADNLRVTAAIYIKVATGEVKDLALQQAAEQDPTGALAAYQGAESAAEAEFEKTYGAKPVDFAIQKVQARITDYQNVDSPEALLRLMAEDQVPGGKATIEVATKAYQDIRDGKSPKTVVKNMATNAWNSGEDGKPVNERAAEAAQTAVAMQAAAQKSLEDADKTGIYAASNTYLGAGTEEFAKTFGGTPQELGIKALQNPRDALNQAKDVAKDVFTTPNGAVNIAKGGISLVSNMSDAALFTAKQQLDIVGAKFGDAGKAAAFVAKYGITAVSEVKNFVQDAASTVTGGLIPKSGPSKTEVEAGIAFAKAQAEVARAEVQKAEDVVLLQYLKAAQDMATLKAQMAVGVVNAKAQVGQYLVAAKTQSEKQKSAVVMKEIVSTEFTRVVQTGLTDQIQSTQAKVSSGSTQSTQQMEALASAWKGGR
jgi:hypothetical protein